MILQCENKWKVYLHAWLCFAVFYSLAFWMLPAKFGHVEGVHVWLGFALNSFAFSMLRAKFRHVEEVHVWLCFVFFIHPRSFVISREFHCCFKKKACLILFFYDNMFYLNSIID